MNTDAPERSNVFPFIAAALAGIAVGAAGFIVTKGNEEQFWYWPAAMAAVGLVFGTWRPGIFWATATIAELGLFLGAIGIMVRDWNVDPTAHNLWPIALFFIGLISFPSALITGGLIAALRLWRKRANTEREER